MIRMIAVLSFGVIVHGSGVLHENIIGPAPVVTAASSQYFQRTFNRLVVAPPLGTVTPVAPQVIAAQAPIAVNTPVAAFQPDVSPESNIAIAIATAHAAPISTILVPPFAIAPNTIPILPPINVSSKEETTEKPVDNKNTKETVTNRPQMPELAIEPASNNNDISQLPLESNTKVFNSYGMVPPKPPKPQKLRTQVEIVPVPLAYIAPPPLKPIKYVRKVVPSKIIIRPARPVKYISVPLRIRYKVPAKSSSYRVPSQARSFNPSVAQPFLRRPANNVNIRDVEPTTFSPFNRPNTKPPKL